MSNKAQIENYPRLSENLCEEWQNTKHRLDEHVKIFLTAAIIAILDSIPHYSEDQNLSDLKNKNEAIEELEGLYELIDLGCRHNNYGQQHKRI